MLHEYDTDSLVQTVKYMSLLNKKNYLVKRMITKVLQYNLIGIKKEKGSKKIPSVCEG